MPAVQRTNQNTATYFLLVPNVIVRGGPCRNYWFTSGVTPSAFRLRRVRDSGAMAHPPVGGDAGN